jgi:Ser-tRNA(Ala) deacylase AlaX
MLKVDPRLSCSTLNFASLMACNITSSQFQLHEQQGFVVPTITTTNNGTVPFSFQRRLLHSRPPSSIFALETLSKKELLLKANTRLYTKPLNPTSKVFPVQLRMATTGSPSKSEKVEDLTRPTAVGALACQMKSYLKELTTTVISCTPVISSLVADKEAEKGKKAKTSEPASPTSEAAANAADPASPTEFDIVFHNSVLFPEGGGQPHDTGVINGNIRVKKVRRVGDTCVVTTDQPLSPGQEAHMIVDWNRRQDHMQHHTAQHVLTAVVEEMLNLPTESWAMSSPTCYIQVPCSLAAMRFPSPVPEGSPRTSTAPSA